jgi:D-amino-acid dehydrogenase
MKKYDPSLKHIDGCVGATYTPSDWTGDIHKFCYELMNILRTKYNVQFTAWYKIHTLAIISKQFDAVIVSAGVGSEELANSIGDRLDVYPVKGYSITINNVTPPAVSLLDDEAKIVTSSLGNKFRVAGTAELAGENYDIRRDRIDPLLSWVHKNFPDMNTHDYTQWACLRPMAPNMMPVTKQSDKNKKVFYNTGHGHLGWTLGAVTAKQIVDMI